MNVGIMIGVQNRFILGWYRDFGVGFRLDTAPPSVTVG